MVDAAAVICAAPLLLTRTLSNGTSRGCRTVRALVDGTHDGPTAAEQRTGSSWQRADPPGFPRTSTSMCQAPPAYTTISLAVRTTSLLIGRWLRRSEERRVGKECRSWWSPYH